MTDFGILMTAPMVEALLTGQKTQTRRLAWRRCNPKQRVPRIFRQVQFDGDGCLGIYWEMPTVWQKAEPGDRIYVRETIYENPEAGNYYYSADNKGVDQDNYVTLRRLGYPRLVRPNIHMPRKVSRLTLVLTEVRRQRLQEISEEDAVAEGIVKQEPTAEDLEWYEAFAEEQGFDPKENPMEGVWLAPGTRQGYGSRPNDPQWGPTATFAYRCLWNHLHGKDAWDENQEVVVLSFRCLKANIDQL